MPRRQCSASATSGRSQLPHSSRAVGPGGRAARPQLPAAATATATAADSPASSVLSRELVEREVAVTSDAVGGRFSTAPLVGPHGAVLLPGTSAANAWEKAPVDLSVSSRRAARWGWMVRAWSPGCWSVAPGSISGHGVLRDPSCRWQVGVAPRERSVPRQPRARWGARVCRRRDRCENSCPLSCRGRSLDLDLDLDLGSCASKWEASLDLDLPLICAGASRPAVLVCVWAASKPSRDWDSESGALLPCG
jgi:hypothetical protein